MSLAARLYMGWPGNSGHVLMSTLCCLRDDKVKQEKEIPIPPMTRGGIAYHAVGVVLNVGWTLWGMVWLVRQWSTIEPPSYSLVLALLAGLFLSDFFSGLLHWAFDTWFSEDIYFLQRMVLLVREHHVYPQHIFRYKLRYEAGIVSWVSLIHTIPVIGFYTLKAEPNSVFGYCAVGVSVMVSVFTMFMLQFHKLGHRKSHSKIINILQKGRLVMSPRHHGQHHRGDHDIRYCLINGWADLVLDFIGFWRGLERLISLLTGAIPRSNDYEWMTRYGRRKI
jgi:hypothetical protein